MRTCLPSISSAIQRGITAAYATGVELAVMSLIVLLAMTLLAPQRKDAR